MTWRVLRGDCVGVLAGLDDCSIDAVAKLFGPDLREVAARAEDRCRVPHPFLDRDVPHCVLPEGHGGPHRVDWAEGGDA